MKSEKRQKAFTGRFLLLALVVFLLIAASQNVHSAKIEVGGPIYYSEDKPQTLALGDVNGDGHLDIVAGNDVNSVSTLYNNGTGSFNYRTDSSSLWDLTDIDMGDIDGDGDPDAVVGSPSAFGATLLFNNGTGYPISGTSAADGDGRTDYGFPSFINAVCFGDMDGDSDLDLLVPSEDSMMGLSIIATYRNNGTGGFENREDLQADLTPSDLAMVDMDRDGMDDIVGVRSTKVSIYLNNGSGGFPLTGTPEADSDGRTDYPLKWPSNFLEVTDLNNDGYPDLALLSRSNSVISVYFNDGLGVLTDRNEYTVGNIPEDIACSDMDEDGDVDMVTANRMDNTVTIWFNNGRGAFSIRLDLPGGKGTNGVDLGDIDGDGDCDIVVANGYSAKTITVIHNRGGGAFGVRTDYMVLSTGYWVNSVSVGDSNNDGCPDVVVSSAYSDSVALLMGNGGGGLSQPVFFDTGTRPYHAELADVNGDGWDDILAVTDTTSVPNVLTVLLNDGAGNFPLQGTPGADADKRTDYPLDNRARYFRVADVDGDSDQDVIAASYYGYCLALFKNNGAGDFSSRTDLDLGNSNGAKSLDVGDVDGDGHPDLVAGNHDQKSLAVLINDGSGNFPIAGTPAADADKRTDYPIGEWIDQMCLADVDDDGDLDAATVAKHPSNKLVITKNDGSGSFFSPQTYSPGIGANYVRAGDLDGDGYPDLAVVNREADTLVVLVNNQKGGYYKKYTFPVDVKPIGLALVDLDEDFDLDVVVVNEKFSSLSIYLNQGDTIFPQDSDDDGVADAVDAFKDGSSDWMDSDSDGYGDNSDQIPWDPFEYVDADGDGHGDQFGDTFPQNPSEWSDSDGDGWGDNSDAYPQDNSEWLDSDNDNIGDNKDFMPFDQSQKVDTDGDGHGDNAYGTNGDMFPNDSTEWWDADGDGYGDNFEDAFPEDPSQWSDADGDGYGDNPLGNNPDEFKTNPVEWEDSDDDGIGDNSDSDDDNDGYSDTMEQSYGTDMYDPQDHPQDYDWDLTPDDRDEDDDNDGFSDSLEQNLGYDSKDVYDFPPDNDGDGIPDAVDEDDDNDGWTDKNDAFPYNPAGWKDSDSDSMPDEIDGSISNTSGLVEDLDDDNDSILDVDDDFPENPNEWSDTDSDGIGDNTDSDIDNDGWSNNVEESSGSDQYDASSVPPDFDSDGVADNADLDDDNDGVLDYDDFAPLDANVQKDPNLVRIAGVEFEVGELVIGLLMAVGALFLGSVVFTRKKRLYNRYKNQIDESSSVSELNEINSEIKSKGEKEHLTYMQMSMLKEHYDDRYMNLREGELEDKFGELPSRVEERIKDIISDKIITEDEFEDMQKWLLKLRDSKTFDSAKKEKLQKLLKVWVDENIE